MKKERINIPRSISDKVLKEFNHNCAICNQVQPHLHHINEDPSDNDPLNLIPLCPNCHLIDEHNPTKKIDPNIIKLFRIHKDPMLLKPQFQLLFNRMQFLELVEKQPDPDLLENKSLELVEFISSLKMGQFYSKKVNDLLSRPESMGGGYSNYLTGESHFWSNNKQRTEDYVVKVQTARIEVYSLMVELLRFQDW
ncbi:MAG: HNH endonuclease [Armatimonadetes bacterium]|nr:HNH endonuclease [Armatimonadota bacterium]